MTTNTAGNGIDTDDVDAMRASVVHGLQTRQDSPESIEIALIDEDPTNPGLVTSSMRDKRREPSIRDSYDILGAIIYPVLVCESSVAGRYTLVDGHGRLRQSLARGEKRIKAYVYPQMTLEQRILFRQTLNAAQEPFDVASIITDMQRLAEERGLNLSDKSQVKTLLRDLPARVRKYEPDLLILARWDPQSAARLGESGGLAGGTIGIDKLRAFDRIVDLAVNRHPVIIKELGGEKGFTKRLSELYLDGKFSTGSRSQEVIRRVAKAMKVSEEDDPTIQSFFLKTGDAVDIERLAEATPRPRDLKSACRNLIDMLLDVDASALSAEERRILQRTHAVLQGVLT